MGIAIESDWGNSQMRKIQSPPQDDVNEETDNEKKSETLKSQG